MVEGTQLMAAGGWFIAIVVAIPLLLWMFKRSPIGARMGSSHVGGMRSVAQLALSPQQKLVTVEVGVGEERRWLVLGVAPGGINLLYSLTPQDPPAPAPGTPTTPAEGFQQLLSRLKRDGSGFHGKPAGDDRAH